MARVETCVSTRASDSPRLISVEFPVKTADGRATAIQTDGEIRSNEYRWSAGLAADPTIGVAERPAQAIPVVKRRRETKGSLTYSFGSGATLPDFI